MYMSYIIGSTNFFTCIQGAYQILANESPSKKDLDCIFSFSTKNKMTLSVTGRVKNVKNFLRVLYQEIKHLDIITYSGIVEYSRLLTQKEPFNIFLFSYDWQVTTFLTENVVVIESTVDEKLLTKKDVLN